MAPDCNPIGPTTHLLSGFFKRSIHRNRVYTCKVQGEQKGLCPIDKTHRNQCRACRLRKCFEADMNRDGGKLQQDTLQEATARLLFTVISWIKQIPAFVAMSSRDQNILLSEGWRELFLLGLVQWDIPLTFPAILSPSSRRELHGNDEGITGPIDDVKNLREVVSRFRHLAVDPTEMACLKAIALFKPEPFGLREVRNVECLQDQAQVMLGEYIRHRYPQQLTRFGKLLMLLPSLRAIKWSSVDELFFKSIVGNTSVEALVLNIFNGDRV
ncbi:photoreceptor-specific nuclear receptor-like [Liolophura sinensis]|uniref:photoreceptor-specific nuclear receptor-like n=1 Tax=Liolophura sinensis TaxID=3198878 RepID=UPI003159333C